MHIRFLTFLSDLVWFMIFTYVSFYICGHKIKVKNKKIMLHRYLFPFWFPLNLLIYSFIYFLFLLMSLLLFYIYFFLHFKHLYLGIFYISFLLFLFLAFGNILLFEFDVFCFNYILGYCFICIVLL